MEKFKQYQHYGDMLKKRQKAHSRKQWMKTSQVEG